MTEKLPSVSIPLKNVANQTSNHFNQVKMFFTYLVWSWIPHLNVWKQWKKQSCFNILKIGKTYSNKLIICDVKNSGVILLIWPITKVLHYSVHYISFVITEPCLFEGHLGGHLADTIYSGAENMNTFFFFFLIPVLSRVIPFRIY